MAEIEFGNVVFDRFGAKKRPFFVSVVSRSSVGHRSVEHKTKRGTRLEASPYYIYACVHVPYYHAVPSMRR